MTKLLLLFLILMWAPIRHRICQWALRAKLQ